jgi:hypothetical protein
MKQRLGPPSTKQSCFELGEVVAISKFATVYFGDEENSELYKLHEKLSKDLD